MKLIKNFEFILFPRCNDGSPTAPLYKVLLSEHNRIAGDLYSMNPFWDESALFLETRRTLAAVIQHITYNEFLPVLLGEVTHELHTHTLDKFENMFVVSLVVPL